MFDAKYHAWNQSRIKAIIDHYTYKFFFGKKVLDLGSGYGDLGGVLYRLGSDVVAVDARQEHLKVIAKKYTGIKTVKANLDGPWPFYGQKFDFTLDLGLICHLSSFENHLKMVCASTNYLVLETAVCDSDDPNKCIQIPESKEVYDLSYGNMGCRPSAAAIERVLAACNMSFKRYDNSKFNASGYLYDWQPKNDNSTSLEKRRIWFASKLTSAEISPNNPSPQSSLGFIPTLPEQKKPKTKASPRSPMPSRMGGGAYHHSSFTPEVKSLYIDLDPASPAKQVKNNSREFSVISPELFKPNTTFDINGVIRPITKNNKMWLSKIAPFFPNIKIPKDIVNMIGFNKANDNLVDVVMCNLETLMPAKRVWIEEWDGKLNVQQIQILGKCNSILTSSLLNMAEILKNIPNANIDRVEKIWPLINSQSIPNNYIYFEKNTEITNLLLNAWEEKFGKLYVIGANNKLPSFAEFVSDCSDYQRIMDYMTGAKALIDISHNTYYQSGILSLANSINLPVITNNKIIVNKNVDCILIDQENNEPIKSTQINTALNYFINQNKITNINFNNSHNQELNKNMMKLIGAPNA